MKEIGGRVIAALIALLTISVSLINIFAPESQIESARLVPEGIAGLSNFRVGMGSGFLAAGVLSAYVAIRAQREFLIPVAVFFGCVLFARLVGFASDGVDPTTVRFTVLATAILLASLGAHRLLQTDEDKVV